MTSPSRILVLGDSIAADAEISFANHLQISTQNDDQVRVVVSAVPSSNVFDILDRTQELLPSDSDFDFAVIQVGINDSKRLTGFGLPLVPLDWFASRLEILCQRLEADGIRPILCGLPRLAFERIASSEFLKPYWGWDVDEYQSYSARISAIAHSRPGREFVGLWAPFSVPRRSDLFKEDGVHPNAQGQLLMAHEINAVITRLATTT